MSNCGEEKPWRYHLKQVIKVNTISNGINWNHVPHGKTEWEKILLKYYAKSEQPISNHEEKYKTSSH